ncbi:MAG: tRNA (guanosine(37)-N1)-methyltransferase TrmD [Candidatus Uhrbacteria bacterium]|nr:tRNA (guanosine(37)-N1)-methyltransferase TrmD [Candidatus Uhrbacteria bacterium]
MQFDILTIFPAMIDSYTKESILGRAQKAKLIEVKAHDIRTYSTDKHHKVDDTPYGGGPGMVMKVEPFDLALKKIKKVARGKGLGTRVILTAANGKSFTQDDARRLASYKQIIFLCGRYEGIDQRVEDNLVDETFSIGNYVLTGGELPALVMTDAIARNIPGVLGAEASLDKESHTEEGYLEYPQYTKPETYKKWSVPEILLSGDHKKIETWREDQSKKKKRE